MSKYLLPLFLLFLLFSPTFAYGIDTVTLSDIDNLRVFQRISNVADIAISGTCTGADEAIEYRIVRNGTGTAIAGHDWQTLDASSDCAGAGFTGTATAVPYIDGGEVWYNVQVRGKISTAVTDSGANKWCVGDLIAGAGQSLFHQGMIRGTDLTADVKVSMYNSCCLGDLGPASWMVPTGNGAVILGNTIVENTGACLAILNFSVGGCPLLDTATPNWSATGAGTPWGEMSTGITALGGSVRAFIYVGMESDMLGTRTQTQLEIGINDFITNKARSLGNASGLAQLPIIWTVPGRYTTVNDVQAFRVRSSIYNAITSGTGTYIGGWDTDLPLRDTVHLTDAAFTTYYRRIAQTYLDIFGYDTYHRGPVITTADVTGSTTIDATVTHVGGSDLTAGPYTGFSVFWNGTSIGVASATKVDADTIRITTSANVPPGSRLVYQYGANPDVTTPVKDNSALALPLEGIQNVAIRTTLNTDAPVTTTSSEVTGGTTNYNKNQGTKKH